MASKDEISAIDAIYDILSKIDNIDKRISLIDSNIKLLNNKVSKVISSGAAVRAAPPDPEPDSGGMVEHAAQKGVDKLVLGNIKTFGYIVNKSNVPIEDVAVTVYADDSSIVKSLFSNEDGYWEVRLPGGEYGVEYIHKNFKPINKVISLQKDMLNFEVR
tara:strand:- start:4598 stop:5077 length:480 start_codon:yes stop_codon:yes gene_type:complete